MNFDGAKKDSQVLSDKVYAAMETGNPAQARLVLKEHEETYPAIVREIRRSVLIDYGTRV